MQEHDQHASPIQSPRQLVIVVVLAFIVPIAIIVLVSQLVTGTPHGRAESDPRILPRIKAVGTVVMAGDPSLAAVAAAPVAVATAAPAAGGAVDGKSVYDGGCMACHGAGIAGAPKFGDKAAWAPRLAQGVDGLVASVIKGKGAMPPRGGSTGTDAEIKAVVTWMVGQAK